MLEDSDLLLANLVQGETVESLMKALGLTEKEAEYMMGVLDCYCVCFLS